MRQLGTQPPDADGCVRSAHSQQLGAHRVEGQTGGSVSSFPLADGGCWLQGPDPKVKDLHFTWTPSLDKIHLYCHCMSRQVHTKKKLLKSSVLINQLFFERTSSRGSGKDQRSGRRPAHLKDGGVGDPDGEQRLGAQQRVQVDLAISTCLHKQVPGGAGTNPRSLEPQVVLGSSSLL